MIDPNAVITIPLHVEATTTDNSVVILNFETGDFFGLDEVGARLWELLNQFNDLNSVIQILLQEYEVDEEKLTKDITKVVTELQEAGLVEASSV